MKALILLVVVLFAPEAGAGDEDQAQVFALSFSPSSSSSALLKGCDWGPGALIPEEIVGGMESKPHSRPYMAHLEIITDSGSAANCGGFLISQQFVMTAAHCEGRKITVTLGVHNLTQEESTWQRRKVAKQIVHPNYNSLTNLNDIMLLKLQRRAKLTHAVGTVSLPARSAFIQPGRVCRTAGWGKTGVMKPGSDVLREVKLRIMNGKACDHFQLYNHTLQICVGNPRKKRSAFKGDSGDPLLCAGVAHGIVSYGRGNAKPPAIFTRISPYVPWIKKILKGDELRSCPA